MSVVFVCLWYTTICHLSSLFFFSFCCFGRFARSVVSVVITRAVIHEFDVTNRVRLCDYLSICGGYEVIEW